MNVGNWMLPTFTSIQKYSKFPKAESDLLWIMNMFILLAVKTALIFQKRLFVDISSAIQNNNVETVITQTDLHLASSSLSSSLNL